MGSKEIGGIGKKGKRGMGKDEIFFCFYPFPYSPLSLLPRLPTIDFFPVTKLDFDLPLGVCQIKMCHGL